MARPGLCDLPEGRHNSGARQHPLRSKTEFAARWRLGVDRPVLAHSQLVVPIRGIAPATAPLITSRELQEEFANTAAPCGRTLLSHRANPISYRV